MKQVILEHDLDVAAPRKRGKQAKKQLDSIHHDSLLHVAARNCDEELVMFLVERGMFLLSTFCQSASTFYQ